MIDHQDEQEVVLMLASGRVPMSLKTVRNRLFKFIFNWLFFVALFFSLNAFALFQVHGTKYLIHELFTQPFGSSFLSVVVMGAAFGCSCTYFIAHRYLRDRVLSYIYFGISAGFVSLYFSYFCDHAHLLLQQFDWFLLFMLIKQAFFFPIICCVCLSGFLCPLCGLMAGLVLYTLNNWYR